MSHIYVLIHINLECLKMIQIAIALISNYKGKLTNMGEWDVYSYIVTGFAVRYLSYTFYMQANSVITVDLLCF